MIDERMEEQASLYVVGGLSGEETRAFELALQGDPELRQLVASLNTAAQAFAGTAPLTQPPAGLKEKILSRIESRESGKIVSLPTKPTAETRQVVWVPWTLAACLAILCSVLGARENELRSRIQQLNQMAKSFQQTTNDLQATITALKETNRLDNLRIAMLGSLLTDQPKAVAVSLWDGKNQTGVFVVQNLKPLPKDRDYQLWVVDPKYKTPVDAGVFQVDAQGNARIQFKTKLPVAVADKFAVTQEVKGGVEVSKGPLILAGG